MKKFFRLISSCVFLALGYSFLSDYFDKGMSQQAEEKIQSLEKLVESSKTTTAMLDSIYSERIIRVAGVNTTFYETKYFFSVGGSQYEGLYKPESRPNETQITVSYLEENPAVNSVNASKELEVLKEDERSNFKLFVGLGLLVTGGLGLWSYISRILKNRKERRDEEERIMDEERERVNNLLNNK